MGKIAEAIEMTHNAVSELDYSLLKEMDELSVHELGEVVVAVHAIVQRLRDLQAAVDSEIASDLKVDEPMEVAGKTITKKVGSVSEKWDSKGLKSAVAERVMMNHMNPETGAIEGPLSQIITEALECASISKWRVKALKDTGINPELYREKTGRRTSIIVS